MTNNIGEIVHKIIKNKGISQTELAEKLGIAQTTISSWKRGKNPSTKILLKLSEELKVPIEKLTSGENSNNFFSNSGIIGNENQTISNSTINENNLLSSQEIELLRIYNNLNFKNQIKLLNLAIELEESKNID